MSKENMDEIESLQEETNNLSDNIYEFLSNPNKTKSKNLRVELGEMKKKITDYRSILMELDKKGY